MEPGLQNRRDETAAGHPRWLGTAWWLQQCGHGHCHDEGWCRTLDVGYVQHAALGGGIDAHANLWSQIVMCPVLSMYEATICLLVLLERLNFRGGVSPRKSQIDWAFVSGSNLYTQVSSPLRMFHVEFARPLSYFSSMVKHHCTLPTFCSSVSWCGTHLAHRLWTPSWWCRISFKADMPIPSMSWRSLQVICVSSLISSLAQGGIFLGGSRNKSATTVIIIKMTSTKSKLLKPLANNRFSWGNEPKSFTQFFPSEIRDKWSPFSGRNKLRTKS